MKAVVAPHLMGRDERVEPVILPRLDRRFKTIQREDVVAASLNARSDEPERCWIGIDHEYCAGTGEWMSKRVEPSRIRSACQPLRSPSRPSTMQLGHLAQDLRYTVRTLRRDAGFALFAIAIAGLGIGASSTVFSVVNTLLLRPLPFAEPERLVWIANHDTAGLSGQTTQVGHMLGSARADAVAFGGRRLLCLLRRRATPS